MKLGIFLSLGSSFTDQKKSGQDQRFIDNYLKKYNQVFTEIDIFSYAEEKYELPQKCLLIANKWKINRFLYSLLLPIFYFQRIKQIDVFRTMQLTGVIPAILTKILINKPFIFTYGYDYHAFARLEGQTIRPLLLKILERLAMKFTSTVIVTTRPIWEYLQKKYPNTNLVYIPNGIDITKFKMQRVKSKNNNQNLEIIRLLFVGRLERQKNLESLIKAVSLLNNKFKIQLLFIGQGSLKDQLTKLAGSLNVNLKIINKISHNKMGEYYQDADMFVLPSFMEGHPKALLEAMACGLACIAARYKGVEEFIDKKEVLITGFEPKEIAWAIDKLINNNGLKQYLSNNARQKIVKDYNLNKLLMKEISLLKNA